MDITPYRVAVPEVVLEDLRRRLEQTRWPDQLPDVGWSYGADAAYLQELVAYWKDGFDWRAVEETINGFPQFIAQIDGQDLHFLHVRSAHPNARPLLMLHGWPSSPLEFLELIEPLTDPVAHGGRVADAFHVIVPSLPGFAFSGPTTETGWSPSRIGDALVELLDGLGYRTFYVQGGDFGSAVAGQIASRFPERVKAMHLNYLIAGGLRPEDGAPTPEEVELAAVQEAYNARETAYLILQMTKPQTIAYSLADSPVGLAAWLVEKFHRWTDHDGDLESAMTKDEILRTVTTYWVTGTGGSSGRLYYETAVGGQMAPVSPRIETPIAYADFPREITRTSRRIAEIYYNIVRWSPQPRGGHFPAVEAPELLLADLREAFRDL